MSNTRYFGKGTYLVDGPYHNTIGGRVLCPDGKLRSLKRLSQHPDTFFSHPAAVSAYGKTVTGFISFHTEEGYSTPTEHDPIVVYFTPNDYGKNANVIQETN